MASLTDDDTETTVPPVRPDETVVFDTSALMLPVQGDVRVFEGVEQALGVPTTALDLVVPRAVVAELDDLSTGAGAQATAASVGRDLAERCRVVDTEESYADDAVVAAALSAGGRVVTNDGPLRDRLLDHGVGVLGPRGHGTLAVTEP